MANPADDPLATATSSTCPGRAVRRQPRQHGSVLKLFAKKRNPEATGFRAAAAPSEHAG
jgi:hypothetical protein